MTAQAAPVVLAERLGTLDAIRGFALLGIFIMNMPFFNESFFTGADGVQLWPRWWDTGTTIVREVVFSGKFNSMFSMLFAVGFTIQLERLEQRQPDRAVAIYVRRIFWLFLFGLVHACVFWAGDILHMYALFGLLLLALRRVPDKVIIALIAASFCYPGVVELVRAQPTSHEYYERLVEFVQQWIALDDAIYGHGSFVDTARRNTQMMWFSYTDPESRLGMLAGYVQILTTMLLGLLLGRRRFFQNVAQHLPLIRRLQWWAFGVGLVSGIGYGIHLVFIEDPVEPSWKSAITSTCYVVCRVAIMIFYVSLIVRGVHNPTWRARMAPVTLAGRMPLTNYLLQTLIATSLFFGWGLGLWGTVGPALDLVLAVAIFFLIQVPLSAWWLNRFRYGPMEYLWRVLTYGRAAVG